MCCRWCGLGDQLATAMPQENTRDRKANADWLIWLRWCAFSSGAGGAAIGAIGGLTGSLRTEYPIKAWQHAVFFALMFGGNGLLIGTVIGLVALTVRWLWIRIRHADNPLDR